MNPAAAGKGTSVIEYRSFRNDDPPRLAAAWTPSLAGPRTIPVAARATTLLEYFLLAKPYFDRPGLTLALDDGQPVGFALAGFAPDADGTGLDTSVGIVCALGVVPARQRQGVGGELLRRSEEYLRGRGARRIVAGSMAPANPFLFGLYGGCDSPGILSRQAAAEPFLARHGYRPARRCGIHRLSLPAMQVPADLRAADIRHHFDIVGAPLPAASWFREAALGPVEVFQYQLRERATDRDVARLLLWDMELFAQLWQQTCVGLLDLTVEPAHRRRGLGRYLLGQVLRHLRDQTFSLFEARVDDDNDAAQGLLAGFGFERVESGATYERDPA